MSSLPGTSRWGITTTSRHAKQITNFKGPLSFTQALPGPKGSLRSALRKMPSELAVLLGSVFGAANFNEFSQNSTGQGEYPRSEARYYAPIGENDSISGGTSCPATRTMTSLCLWLVPFVTSPVDTITADRPDLITRRRDQTAYPIGRLCPQGFPRVPPSESFLLKVGTNTRCFQPYKTSLEL